MLSAVLHTHISPFTRLRLSGEMTLRLVCAYTTTVAVVIKHGTRRNYMKNTSDDNTYVFPIDEATHGLALAPQLNLQMIFIKISCKNGSLYFGSRAR